MKSVLLLSSAMSFAMFSMSASAQTAGNVPTQDQPDETAPAEAKVATAGQLASDGSIVVTGYRASLESAREQKRRSDAIMDSVAAEDIGQLPDNSATEALARLPGVQVLRNRGEAQGITLRGLAQTLTTVNGQESYYGTSRRSLLNAYPASIIGSMQIYKALTPDMIEGGIGGAVNVQLRQPFDFKKGMTVVGSLRGTYDDNIKGVNYNADLMVSGRWDTGIGEIGLMLNGSYLRRDYLESYRQNQVPTATTGTATSPTGENLGRGLIYPLGMLVRNNDGGYKRPVFTGALQWKPNEHLAFDLRYTRIIDDNEYADNYLATTAAANTAFTNVVLVPGTNIIKSATFRANGAFGPYSSYVSTKNDTTQVDFGATWRGGIATISSRAVYTHTTSDTLSRSTRLLFKTVPTINATFQTDSKYGGVSYDYGTADLTDPNNFYVNNYGDVRYNQEADGLQWRTDLNLDTGSGFIRAIKVGTRYAGRTAKYQYGARAATLTGYRLGISDLPGGDQPKTINAAFDRDDVSVPSSWVGYDGWLLGDSATYSKMISYIASKSAALASTFSSALPDFNPTSGFEGSEDTYAFYGQVKYGFPVGSIEVDGIVGARVVNTALSMDGTRSTTRAGLVTLTPINQRQNYLDVDPSILANIHFTRALQLRLGWTKTFSRPEFSQLSPSTILNVSTGTDGSTGGTASAGNPDLKPLQSKNLDASLEWYFGRVGMISVGAFRRDINGYIVNGYSYEDVEGVDQQVRVTRPFNAGDGVIKGLEFSASSFFDFAPGILKHFGASANLTLMDAKQDLPTTGATVGITGDVPAVSKRTLNASLFYDDGKFRARVAYSTRSRFLLAYNTLDRNYDQYYYPINNLAVSVTYRITPAVSLNVDASNILGEPQYGYWGDSNFTDRVYYEGRQVSAAVRFKF